MVYLILKNISKDISCSLILHRNSAVHCAGPGQFLKRHHDLNVIPLSTCHSLIFISQ